MEQLKTVGVTLVLVIVGTIVIAYITKVLVGLRPTEEVEIAGLDDSEHGEEGYHDVKAGKVRRCAGCWLIPKPAQFFYLHLAE